MEKESTEIAAIWLRKAQKAGFFSPDKREYYTSKCKGKNKKKEQGEREEEKGKKSDVCTTLDEKITAWRKRF